MKTVRAHFVPMLVLAGVFLLTGCNHSTNTPAANEPIKVGEFASLTGGPPADDRIEATRALAARCGAVVLLKGPTTVVAEPGGTALLVTAGSPRLATAGTGDVLSGAISAFVARGLPLFEAAGLAAHVHGRAAARGRPEGLVASDLADLISDWLSEGVR